MRAVTCIGMNARVKPPYDPAKDEGYWGLRRALACVSGARGDKILTRYDEWRATPRPSATRVFVGPARSFKRPRSEDGSPRRLAWVKDEFGRRLGGLRWVGRGFAEFQTGLLLWCRQGYAPALNRAVSLVERRCARTHDPLVADGRGRDGIRRVITPLEWADLVLVDAGAGPEVYDSRDATAAALGAGTPAFSDVRFLVADVLKAFSDTEPAELKTPPPAEPPLPGPFLARWKRPPEPPSTTWGTEPAPTPESQPAGFLEAPEDGLEIGAGALVGEQSTPGSAFDAAVEYFLSHEATDRDADVKAAHRHFNGAIPYRRLISARAKAGVRGKYGRPAKPKKPGAENLG
jgi:hypothetical protein